MLEIVIGLTFFYLLLGLICSVITEFISSMLDLRAKYLHWGIQTLLKDPVLVEQFYEQPMIESLRINRELPPYIPARSFALSILALVTGSSNEYSSFQDIRHTLYTLPEDGATGRLKRILLIMTEEAREDTDRLRANIEFWFTSTMDRIAGMYKRRIQWLLFATAVAVTVAANVNTISIARHIIEAPLMSDLLLSRSSELYSPRATAPFPTPTPITAQPAPSGSPGSAAPVLYPSPSPSPSLQYELEDRPTLDARSRLSDVETTIARRPALIGWSYNSPTPFGGGARQALNTFLGWLITALATTIFALFWFDVLNRFIVVRTAIKPFDEAHSASIENRENSSTPIVT